MMCGVESVREKTVTGWSEVAGEVVHGAQKSWHKLAQMRASSGKMILAFHDINSRRYFSRDTIQPPIQSPRFFKEGEEKRRNHGRRPL